MIAAALLACDVNVAPATLEAVISVESGGNPLALYVNHLEGRQPHANRPDEATKLARHYIAAGYSVDIGLMQINSRNLAALGYTVEQALDPCTNIRGGATVLTANYVEASQRFTPGQPALQAALSAYNTGTFWRGFENGYVARYYGRPTIPGATLIAPIAAATMVTVAPPAQAPAINPYTADITVYQRAATNVPIQ
jgi:type IV secretion system protein VirB1